MAIVLAVAVAVTFAAYHLPYLALLALPRYLSLRLVGLVIVVFCGWSLFLNRTEQSRAREPPPDRIGLDLSRIEIQITDTDEDTDTITMKVSTYVQNSTVHQREKKAFFSPSGIFVCTVDTVYIYLMSAKQKQKRRKALKLIELCR